MARQWKQISLEDAKKHPLYGIKNWLAVFAFMVLIGPLVTIGQFSNAAHQSGLTLPQLLSADIAAGAFIKATIAFNVAIAALSFWFLFSKHRHFRLRSIALLVLQWPAYLVVLFIIGDPKIPGLAGELTIRFLSSLLLIAIWVAYLHRSRRVRVTFENCVLVESSQTPADSDDRTIIRKMEPMAAVNNAYAASMAEIEEGRLDKGVWARAFAESDGDESKAKAAYIRARVKLNQNDEVWSHTQPQPIAAATAVSKSEAPNRNFIDVIREFHPGVKAGASFVLLLLVGSIVSPGFRQGLWGIEPLDAVAGTEEINKAVVTRPRLDFSDLPTAPVSIQTPVPQLDSEKGLIALTPATPSQINGFLDGESKPAQTGQVQRDPPTPVLSPSKPTKAELNEQRRQAEYEAQVKLDLDRASEAAVKSYPYLDTPDGERTLQKIVEKRNLLISQGVYPSIALTQAVNDFAPFNAPRAPNLAR